jgi:hypothetical protein
MVRGATRAHIRRDLELRSDNEPGQKSLSPKGFAENGPATSLFLSRRPARGYFPSSRLVVGPFWAKQQYPEFFNGLLGSVLQSIGFFRFLGAVFNKELL